MPRRITEDHEQFRDVISGKIRKELKDFISSGQIFKGRGQAGKISISIPKATLPNFTFNGSEYKMDQEEVVTTKKKRKVVHRSIMEPFEPAW